MTEGSAATRRFSAAPPPVVALALSLLNLILAVAVIVGSKAQIAALPGVAVFAGVSWSMFRVAKLGAVADGDGLRVSTMTRTRLISWQDIRRVEICPGQFPGTNAAYVHTRDDQLRRIGSLSASVTSPKARGELERIVGDLNAEILIRHRASG